MQITMARTKELLGIAVLLVGLAGSCLHGARYLWAHLAPVGKMTLPELLDACTPLFYVLLVVGLGATIYFRIQRKIGDQVHDALKRVRLDGTGIMEAHSAVLRDRFDALERQLGTAALRRAEPQTAGWSSRGR